KDVVVNALNAILNGQDAGYFHDELDVVLSVLMETSEEVIVGYHDGIAAPDNAVIVPGRLDFAILTVLLQKPAGMGNIAGLPIALLQMQIGEVYGAGAIAYHGRNRNTRHPAFSLWYHRFRKTRKLHTITRPLSIESPRDGPPSR
ncbi:MAG: hypothetical protein LBJ12_04970, partial [Oscillospiraceae bacterium]|nr:hypothetical protein [Oscillospiraceae bacterium]